ncbi:MAG: putative baseplate assembly protein [Vulcanimicrobiaceae bacterium]
MSGSAAIPPFVSDDRRRADVIARGGSGLDYIDVRGDSRTLVVAFFGALPQVDCDSFVISGGERVTGLVVTSVRVASDEPESEGVVTLHVDRAGDASTYVLRVVDVPTVDPLYASLPFTFDLGNARLTDCESITPPSRVDLPQPHVDYLAKDYATFRRLLLDRAALIVPDWIERHIPDINVTLVELLAYVGDRLSYYQDAVATEAYLGTARKRVSVRRHARLLDYRVHEGCNARTWLVVTADDDLPSLNARELVFTTAATITTPAQAFEPIGRHEIAIYAAHAPMRLYAWGNGSCSLELGATAATLSDAWQSIDGEDEPSRALRHLEAGDYVLFESTHAIVDNEIVPADPTLRHVVRLTHVRRALDSLYDVPVVEIAWALADRLPFDFAFAAPDPHDPDAPPIDLGVAWGNVVAVDHGRTLVAAETLASVPPDPEMPYRPRLAEAGLTYAEAPALSRTSASGFGRRSPRDARPQIVELVTIDPDGHQRRWTAVDDLLASGEGDAHFVVEVDENATTMLRFGDGISGRRPVAGSTVRVRYRVGNGPVGNVGPQTIVAVAATGKTPLPRGIGVRQPLAATGGTAGESVEDVRALAPSAFRAEIVRAIAPEDYARIAERDERLQRAAAEFRWTGSRTIVRVALDPLHTDDLDPEIVADVAARLESVRRIGHDVEVVGATYVPLHVALRILVASGYQPGHVRAALEAELGSATTVDGRRGFFHSDALTFGDPVTQSGIVSRALAVTGVRDVSVTKLERLFAPTPNDVPRSLAFGRLEIARLDGDLARPERGVLTLDIGGGS